MQVRVGQCLHHLTAFASATTLALLAKQPLCQGQGQRQLASTTWTAQHQGMGHSVVLYVVQEACLYLFLSYDIAELHGLNDL